MAATAAIAAIGATESRELIATKMLDAGTAVPAAAKYPDLIYKIAFFHAVVFENRQSNEVSGDKLFLRVRSIQVHARRWQREVAHEIHPQIEHLGPKIGDLLITDALFAGHIERSAATKCEV